MDLDNYEGQPPRLHPAQTLDLGGTEGGLFYETDWGNIRPGWHIECTAMSTKYLGETLDIHTASQDLLFSAP